MWWVIGAFIVGYILGGATIACFAVRNYNRGYRDGEKSVLFNVATFIAEAESDED